MNNYEFDLRVCIPVDRLTRDACIKRLGASGCDDALIGIGRPGMIALKFDRKADSEFDAICSAVTEVKKAIPGAKVVEAVRALCEKSILVFF